MEVLCNLPEFGFSEVTKDIFDTIEYRTKCPEFVGFNKIPRLFRDVIITEKIDGTNSQVFVGDNGLVVAGSRTRWITPENDNHGFARWVADHEGDLKELGPGRHFGEWWGPGINRGYGLSSKRFSLFNVSRYITKEGANEVKQGQVVIPGCCGLVPVLCRGIFCGGIVKLELDRLAANGSVASPGFMRPEGIVVYHVASGQSFKYTLDGDGHKGTGGSNG